MNNLKNNISNIFYTPKRINNELNSNDFSTFSPNFEEKLSISKNNIDMKEIFENSAINKDYYTNNKALIFNNSFNDNQSFSSINTNFLHFSSNKKSEYNNIIKNINNIKTKNSENKLRKKYKTPYKILDAPEVKDDYHYNILDWSKNNILATSLNNSIYLCNKNKDIDYLGGVTKLDELIDEEFYSIKYDNSGDKLASGTEFGNLIIYDIEKSQTIQNLDLNIKKISCLSFYDENLISIGGENNDIINYDLRSQKVIGKYKNHSKKILKIKWNSFNCLLASGSDDNYINIWDLRKDNIIYKFKEHTGFTRALDWSLIHQNYLISGSGDNDGIIKFWNVNTGKVEKEIKTKSEIYNIIFSKKTEEFISTHGNDNKIIIWDYNTFKKNFEFEGHDLRVLHSSLSPNGEILATTCGDETLRFWNCFPNSLTNY